MKKNRKVLALLLAVSMLLGLLAGCGNKNTEDEKSPVGKDGKITIHVPLTDEPSSLDPGYGNSSDSISPRGMMYEGLVRIYDNVLAPGLAEKWEVSADGLTYTFHLRESYWSDGVKVTAADFVYAWQRLADPATASPNAALLEMVAGYRQVRSSGDVSKLQVSAPEENTFVVTLSNRCAYFLSAVYTAAATMPVRSEQPKNWQADPTALCTNGAYRISEWKDSLLTATVPESYYDQRRLQMSTLVFRFETDAAMRTELLKKNEVDFVLGLSQEELADEPETWTPDSYPQVMTLLTGTPWRR